MLACAVFLGCFVPASRANDFGAGEVYDLILEVSRNRKSLSNALIGVEKDGKYFLPLLDIARIVDFGAEPDFANEKLSGFYLNDKNQYVLNIKELTYSVNGELKSFSEGDAFILEYEYGIKEFYATPELINMLWPLELVVDPLLLKLEIQTKKKLPYEQRRVRSEYRSKYLDNDDVTLTVGDLPKLNNKPKKFSLPVLDISSSLQYQNNDHSHSENINIGGRNDLAYGEIDYNLRLVNGTDETRTIDDLRVLYTKRAYDEGDLPLDLELFQAGDISVRPAKLVDPSIRGRGILLSNAERKKNIDFDNLVVEGLAEPGWEVELYRNNELIAFQIVSDTGEYRFEDVQLNYNQTIIKTVLYGPQGQVETREDSYNISQDMLKPGTFNYELGLLDSDRDLFVIDEDRYTQPRGFAKNLNLNYGINSHLTAFATLTDMPTKIGAQRYGSLGLKFSLLDTLGSVEAYRSLEGGSAIDFNAARRFLGTNLNLRASFLSDFEGEHVGYGDDADTFSFDASIGRSFILPFGGLGLNAKYSYDQEKSGRSNGLLDLSQSLSFKKLRFTHATKSRFRQGNYESTQGRFNANYTLNTKMRLRSTLNYDFYPETTLRDALVELRYKDREGFTAALNLDRDFLNAGSGIGIQLGQDFERFKGSVDLDWDSVAGARAVLRTKFSLAPFGPNGKYITSSDSLPNRAALNGRIFVDNNYDGIYNDGDEALEGARVKIGQRNSSAVDEDGYARFSGGESTDYETISLDLNEVAEPYMLPATDEFKTLLRSANVLNLDFPVIRTGIIEGIVTGEKGGIASIKVQLLDKDNKLLDETRAAFDGYYSFEYVRPGDYTVRIDPEITQVSIPPRSVSVTSEELFQFGIDLQTLEQTAEAACDISNSDGGITQICHDEDMSIAGVQKSALVTNGENTSGVQAVSTIGKDTSGIQTIPSYKGTSGARVSQVRIGEYSDKLRVVLDLSAPTAIRTWEQSDRKQVTLEIQDVDWQAMQNWINSKPHIIKDFKVEKLGANGVSLTINAAQKIIIDQKMMLTPNGKDFYRFYIDFKKCDTGCY